MNIKYISRIAAALFIVCTLSFGIYMNFGKSSPNILSANIVMV